MIDYQTLIDEAVLNVIKRVLQDHAVVGPEGNQCFYISFDINHPGVTLSRRVKKKHPHYITIVLENQFDNLVIFDNHFTVNLTFDGIKENISVPFKAIISFMDPAANFSLQLRHEMINESELLQQHASPATLLEESRKIQKVLETGGAKVIDFNRFRKDHNK